MFPLEYPLGILEQLDQPQRVADPFCGRGTTLYAAKVLNLEAWGVDASPVAVAISRAKFARATPDEALALAEHLLDTVTPCNVPRSEFWEAAYHPDTLRAICALREGLQGDDGDAAALLTGLTLGCLHGPLVKDTDNPTHFSNQMPRTFAPKPDYAVRFWRKRELVAPRSDVLTALRKKALRLSGETSGWDGEITRVLHGDATDVQSYAPLPRGVDTIITSPPYYGMATYLPDQWLRHWFLGGPNSVDYKAGSQIGHAGQETFTASLTDVWNHVGHLANNTLNLFVRFGSLPSRQVDASAMLRNSLCDSEHTWNIVSLHEADAIKVGRRQAHHMGVNSTATVEYDLHARLEL